MLLAELEARHREEDLATAYGPQVIMLSPLGGEFFLRANIWPSADEHMVRASGAGAFVYGLPHDHNFDFLTFGYFGPGYWSDYWEYDYERVAGAVGEPAGLRFVERSRLEPGKLLHYRAHRDVHAQHPPDALSVSLNVMHAGGAQGWLDQYRFDVERNTIAGVLSPGASEVFLRIAVGLGAPEALDLADRFARTHPSDRMRLTALEAQAGALGPGDRDALWRRAEASGKPSGRTRGAAEESGAGRRLGVSRVTRSSIENRFPTWHVHALIRVSESAGTRRAAGGWPSKGHGCPVMCALVALGQITERFRNTQESRARGVPCVPLEHAPRQRVDRACRITAAAAESIRSARLARLMSWSISAALGADGRPALVPQQDRQAEHARGCGHRRGSPARAGPRCRPC